MISLTTAILIGLALFVAGGCFGLLLASLCAIAAEADRAAEKEACSVAIPAPRERRQSGPRIERSVVKVISSREKAAPVQGRRP